MASIMASTTRTATANTKMASIANGTLSIANGTLSIANGTLATTNNKTAGIIAGTAKTATPNNIQQPWEIAIGNDIKISANPVTIKTMTLRMKAIKLVIPASCPGKAPAKKAIVITNKKCDMGNHSGKKHIVNGRQPTPQSKDNSQEKPHTSIPGHAVINPIMKALSRYCIIPHTRAIILERR